MKVRTDFVTNSSSSSFVCLKCHDHIECYDWDEQYSREICEGCFSQLDEDTKTLVEAVESGSSNVVIDAIDFIEYLCEELCFDREKVMQKYKQWRLLK